MTFRQERFCDVSIWPSTDAIVDMLARSLAARGDMGCQALTLLLRRGTYRDHVAARHRAFEMLGGCWDTVLLVGGAPGTPEASRHVSECLNRSSGW